MANRDAAAETLELADSAGLPLSEAQRFKIEGALGERADGSWAAPEVGDFEPRQNGKGNTIIARGLAGLFLFDEPLQIYTAHEVRTAKECFRRFVAVIERNQDLRRRVRSIRYANGEQGVELRNGNRLEIQSRTGGSGRGFAGVSTLYYDEALYLTDAHLAATGPAMATVPNAQTWYASSSGLSTSAVAWRLRRRALSGRGGRLFYAEHTAEIVTVDDNGKVRSVPPDPDDRMAWALANPLLGFDPGIPVENVERERGQMSTETFLRERLGVWDPELGDEGGPWSPEKWAAVQDLDAAPSGFLAIGVDASPDHAHASIAVAGAGVVELVEHRAQATWLVGRIVEMRERNPDLRNAPVAVDPSGPAGFIIADLEVAGVEVVKVGGQQMGQACSLMFSAVNEGQIRVRRSKPELHSALNGAVSGARTQPKGDVWVWSRKDGTIDVSPLVAATLAHWASIHAPSNSWMFQ